MKKKVKNRSNSNRKKKNNLILSQYRKLLSIYQKIVLAKIFKVKERSTGILKIKKSIENIIENKLTIKI